MKNEGEGMGIPEQSLQRMKQSEVLFENRESIES